MGILPVFYQPPWENPLETIGSIRLLAPAAIKLCVTLGCCRSAGSNFARANLRSEQLKNASSCKPQST